MSNFHDQELANIFNTLERHFPKVFLMQQIYDMTPEEAEEVYAAYQTEQLEGHWEVLQAKVDQRVAEITGKPKAQEEE